MAGAPPAVTPMTRVRGDLAFIHDPNQQFKANCNPAMVEIETVCDDEDVHLLKRLIERHAKYTGSAVAQNILKNFERELDNFAKVMPQDYKKVLVEVRRKMREQGISLEAALYG